MGLATTIPGGFWFPQQIKRIKQIKVVDGDGGYFLCALCSSEWSVSNGSGLRYNVTEKSWVGFENFWSCNT